MIPAPVPSRQALFWLVPFRPRGICRDTENHRGGSISRLEGKAGFLRSFQCYRRSYVPLSLLLRAGPPSHLQELKRAQPRLLDTWLKTLSRVPYTMRPRAKYTRSLFLPSWHPRTGSIRDQDRDI